MKKRGANEHSELSQLQQSVEVLEELLAEHNVPLADWAEGEEVDTQRKYRLQHTRGNTKSQRRVLKRMHVKLMRERVQSLKELLDKHHIAIDTQEHVALIRRVLKKIGRVAQEEQQQQLAELKRVNKKEEEEEEEEEEDEEDVLDELDELDLYSRSSSKRGQSLTRGRTRGSRRTSTD